MKNDFKTYEEARAEAQKRADTAPYISYGLEKNGAYPGYGPWVIFMLPAPRYRSGHELRCEVVDPSNYDNIRK